MIYYMIRLKMKYHYYITHNMKKYNKLNQVINKYKEEFDKPLFFERVLMVILFPVIYVTKWIDHRRNKQFIRRKWRRYNFYFKDVWHSLWNSGKINTSKYLKPEEAYRNK